MGILLLSLFISTTVGFGVLIPFMVITGLGLGPFFSVLQLAAQNAIPCARLGVGTAAVRFVTQIGGVLGIAIIGTVVNQTLNSDITTRVPVATQKLMTPAGFKVATDPQILTNAAYRANILHTAQHLAVARAVSQVPPGPQHAQQVAIVTAQTLQTVQAMLTQLIAAMKISLTFAIHHGLYAILAFAVLMVIATFFLKDIPMSNQNSWAPPEGAQPQQASASEENQPVTQ